MRLGVISDLHGNVEGLRRALDLMGPVDQVWCAGDIVEEFRFDNSTVGTLRELDARCVLGNHDLGFLGAHGARPGRFDGADASLVRWLSEQPRTIDEVLDGRRVLMTHASPCAPGTQYVLPGSPEVRRIGHEVDADLVIIGHTHRRMRSRVGGTTVLNPGSAGQARDPHNGKQLSFALVEVAHLDIEFTDYPDAARCGAASNGEL